MNKQPYIILITGASSGFGKVSAIHLAQQGHIVYGTSRKKMENCDGIHMLEMDVTRPDSISQAIHRILDEQGRIDVLINNAGIGISGALELATDEEIEWQMNTNFRGVIHVCKAVLPYMRRQRSGKIINISSIGGVIAVPFQGFYSASKFAVEGYTEALALEVRPYGIRVCLVEPGDFHTNFTANRNISEATLQDEDYRDNFTHAMKVIEKAELNGSHPDKLAQTICKLVKKKHPALRTKVGPLEQVLFARCKGWLPDAIVQFVMRIFYF